MRVSIFGLGYVGCVSAGCLSQKGHSVVGVDVVESKVNTILRGKPTVVEPGLDVLFQQGFEAKCLSATTDSVAAVRDTDASLVCVGTPADLDGGQNLDYLARTARDIGRALRQKSDDHLVLIRSTVPPGTTESVVLPIIANHSGRGPNACCVAVVPEFLREGTAVADYYTSALHVVGSADGLPNRYAVQIADLIGVSENELQLVTYREAELVKSVCNVFHALKVAFANEVGALCAASGIDGHHLMGLVCEDRKLNISPAYMRPGLPFGGSCLPKDLAGVVAIGNRLGVSLPLIGSIAQSNESQRKRLLDLLRLNGYRRVGLDGLSFKAGTDDLRQSPLVDLAEYLIGKGYDLKILDPAVDAARLLGANREYIEQHIPHLASRLVSTAAELVEHSELIVLTRSNGEIMLEVAQAQHEPIVLDLSQLAGRGTQREPIVRSYQTVAPSISDHELLVAEA